MTTPSEPRASARADRRSRIVCCKKPTPFCLLVWFACVTPASADTDLATLRAMQDRFRTVAADIRPSLVRIDTVGGTQPVDAARSNPGDPSEGDGSQPKRSQNPFRDQVGSSFVVADGPTTGLVWSADGYIVTSSFNFVREPALIAVTLADGRRLAADLVARDQVRKIALLKVDAADLVVPVWVDPRDIHIGQSTVALGLGYGTDEPAVTVGIISAARRMKGNALQTDAKLSPANYGGPLCDLTGRVLGINIPMAQRPGELAGTEMYDSGVGFAVPKDRLDEIVAVLRTGRSFHRGWLGITVDPRYKDALVIGAVADPSPAKTGGLGPGDKITVIDGKPVNHFGHLIQALNMLPAGQSVLLQIDRAGAEFSAVVTLASSDQLGGLPETAEPFDPTQPTPQPEPLPDEPEEPEP